MRQGTASMVVFSMILAGALGLAAPAAMAAGPMWFAPNLDGARMVGSPGDPEGTGVAFIGLGGDTVTYWILTKTGSVPTAAHLHAGRAGESGGIAVDLETAFTDLGNGLAMAMGSVNAGSPTVDGILADPAAYYVNVHTPDFQAGAVRGQLLGDGAAASALAASLSGAGEVGQAGDADGAGFAGVAFMGGEAHYFIAVSDIAAPTAAHIHVGAAGENGGVVLDFQAAFSGGMASGAVAVDPDLMRRVLADPAGYYVNVHNADFPAGAVRGQLRATETTLSLPVISRAQGQAGSNWRTDLRIQNPAGMDLPVWAEFYPLSASGYPAAAQPVQVVVTASGAAVIDDAVATLFGADGNGALRLLSSEPIVAAARIYNDQSGNPAVGGTYGQFVPGLRPEDSPRGGVLLLGSQVGSAGQSGFRTNLGYFNPTPRQVTVKMALRSPGGEVLGDTEMTVPGFAGAIGPVFSMIPPDAGGEAQDLVVAYSSDGPIQLYSSTVDNVTGDAIYVAPAQAPPTLAVPTPQPENNPPTAQITQPAGDVTIAADESVTFAGMASDPDGDPLVYAWDFGDGSGSTELSPGAHTYSDAGAYTVTFTAEDSAGASASDSVTVTVEAQSGATFAQVQSQIFNTSCAFAGCHAGSSPAQGMHLGSGQAYANIVNVPSNEQPSKDRIEPGSPSMSYLWLKVTGDPSISGSRMPIGGQLSQAQLDLLESWILAGAPENGAGLGGGETGGGTGGGGAYGASPRTVPSH